MAETKVLDSVQVTKVTTAFSKMSQTEINNNYVERPESKSSDPQLTFREVVVSIFTFLFLVARGIFLFILPKRLQYKDVRGLNVLITGAGSGLGQGMFLRGDLKSFQNLN